MSAPVKKFVVKSRFWGKKSHFRNEFYGKKEAKRFEDRLSNEPGIKEIESGVSVENEWLEPSGGALTKRSHEISWRPTERKQFGNPKKRRKAK